MKLKFRCRLIKQDGLNTPWLFYQENQFLTSFLRRCSSWQAFGHDTSEKHETYLPQALDELLDQWTGLKDSKNKEIYSGDVLLYKNPNTTNAAKKVIVIWEDKKARFGCIWEGSSSGAIPFTQSKSRFDNTNFEVIGNLYENPELLS